VNPIDCNDLPAGTLVIGRRYNTGYVWLLLGTKRNVPDPSIPAYDAVLFLGGSIMGDDFWWAADAFASAAVAGVIEIQLPWGPFTEG